MHRGGRMTKTRTEKKEPTTSNMDNEEEEEAGASGANTGTEGEEPTLHHLTGILQAFMGQQEAREMRLQEEAKQQECRLKGPQHQFQLLQMEVQARTSPDYTVPSPDPLEESGSDDRLPQVVHQPAGVQSVAAQPHFSMDPRLEKLTEHDVEHFLITFERIATACKWAESDWVFRLIPLLTGKARSAYVNMDVDDSLDYEKVKTAILHKYDINPESYRQRFRSLDVGPDESPKELYARLK
ncbi:uncharacterized protein LOC112139127, partial [Oryzias melastigma]|uniref:uncharacterized protein LOC112139127 n=1 Tax=Oryzias melastigma TaxID=30732 RepID=UPI000CF7CC6B